MQLVTFPESGSGKNKLRKLRVSTGSEGFLLVARGVLHSLIVLGCEFASDVSKNIPEMISLKNLTD